MVVRVGINGLGRIGRQLVRQIASQPEAGLELVAVNTLGGIELSRHLLQHDSLYGEAELTVEKASGRLIINGSSATYHEQENPEAIPWADQGIDLVIECAGLSERSRGHLVAKAPMVLVAGSALNPDITICMGVNHADFVPARHRFVCGASCTANLVAPAISVLDKVFGVEQVLVTFIHSYTGEQHLLDSGHLDPRRARSATKNIIPVSTSAIAHLAAVFPDLADRIAGLSLRVPTPLGHLADLVLKTEKECSKEGLLASLEEAAHGAMKDILTVSHVPLVSTDFRGWRHSCIVDAEFASVAGKMVKLLIWQDNEYGYCSQIMALARYLAMQSARSAR